MSGTPNTIKIKRTTGNTLPENVAQGELVYVADLLNGASPDRALGKIYIGTPQSTGTNGAPIAIGGTFYTNLLSQAVNGTAEANKALILGTGASASGLGTVSATGLTATTNGVTASDGNVTATLGNFVASAAGAKLNIGGDTTLSRAAAGVFQFDGSSAVIVPSGSTAARPAATAGSLRFNTSGNLEFADGTNWKQVATGGEAVTAVSVASANGFAGTSSGGTTPALTLTTTVNGLLKGDGTGVTAATVTGSGDVVLATSPTLITPTLGAATATTVNGLTISSTTGTLTLANGSTLATSGSNSLTLTTTGATNVTLPTTGTLSTLDGTETLTNKTINGANNPITNVSLTTGVTGTLPIDNGGTGSTTGSITGSGALTFTAGGSNTNVVLAPQGSGTVDVSSKRITSVATPSGDNDAANKAYVDGIAQGLDLKASVHAATTGNITLVGEQNIDGHDVFAGDRVLVKNQTNAAENGIYIVAAGTAPAGNWTRSPDMNQGTEFSGAFTFVEQGSTQADTGWVCTNNGTVVVDTTPITFTQFSSAGVIQAGAGLTKTSNTLSVNTDGSTTEISGNNVVVKDKGVTYAKIQDVAGLSVIGNSSNSSGVSAAITAGADYNVLRRSGTSIGFGAIDLSQTGAVGTSVLAVANGGTGAASLTAGQVVIGNGTSAVSQTANLSFADNTQTLTVGSGTFSGATGGAVTVASTGNANVVLNPGTGSISASSSKIINVATPTAATDAATKGYVDSAVIDGGSY